MNLTLAVDLNHDGLYSHANSDLSADLLAANWHLGRENAHDMMPSAGRAIFILHNATQKFSPEAPTGLALTGKRIRLRLDSTTLWHGWVEKVVVDVHPQGNAILECEQGWLRLQNAPSDLGIQQNRTADTIIDLALSQVIASPLLVDCWMLESDAQGRLNDSTYLYTPADQFDSETGQSLFAYYGDHWTQNTTVYGVIVPAVAAERGLFWQGRDGLFYFRNRHHWYIDTTLDATLSVDNDTVSADYDYGAEVVNVVQVTAYPRRVDTDFSVIWQSASPIAVDAQGRTRLTVNFHNAEGLPVAALQLDYPRAYTDYSAVDDRGRDATARVTMRVDLASRSARVSFKNTHNRRVFITAQLRGQSVTHEDSITLEAFDPDSIATYGRLPRHFELTALNNPHEARDYADWYLDQQHTPYGTIRRITLKGKDTTALNTLKTLTLDSRIELSATQPDHEQVYVIVGEKFAWSPSDGLVGSYVLTRVDTNVYWMLAESLLGVDSTLGY